jgi:outer membrane protein assembly factor BamD (BamD/ComL family)
MILAGMLYLLCACSSPPPQATGGIMAELDQAENLLSQGDARGAEHVLNRVDPEELEGPPLERHELLLAISLHALDESWDAYKLIENFPDRHFLSDFLPRVEELTYLIGEKLIQSDRSWWIFGSDKEDGMIVLATFTSRYPTNPHVPDALKLLGEASFVDKEYEMSMERYKELRANHPRSEWAALASFRLAITAFNMLEGPAYDQKQMEQARQELADYLQLDPERPEFRQQAEEALATVTRWLAQRELINADFYKRIGNEYGEMYHLRTLVERYPDSLSATQARRRLEAADQGQVKSEAESER